MPPLFINGGFFIIAIPYTRISWTYRERMGKRVCFCFCLACVAKKRDIGAAFPVTAATAATAAAATASTSKT